MGDTVSSTDRSATDVLEIDRLNTAIDRQIKAASTKASITKLISITLFELPEDAGCRPVTLQSVWQVTTFNPSAGS